MLPRRSETDSVVRSMNDVNARGAAFIRHFDRQEPRLIEIARTFDRIAAEVKTLVQEAEAVGLGGAFTAGTGGVLGLRGLVGLLAAPLTGGTILALMGAAMAVTGGTIAVAAMVRKSLKDKGGAKELETLGKEFMTVVGLLNEELKEIKAMSRQLVDRSNRITNSLQEMVDTSGDVDDAVKFINVLIQLVMKLLQQISTDKEDVELTNKIIESSDQCWKTIQHLRHMKEELQGFTTSLGELC